MINLESFFDELSNIKTAAQKCRSGSPPIRAGNLAKKSRYDGTGKRTTKLAEEDPRGLAEKWAPAAGLYGGGAAGALGAHLLARKLNLGPAANVAANLAGFPVGAVPGAYVGSALQTALRNKREAPKLLPGDLILDDDGNLILDDRNLPIVPEETPEKLATPRLIMDLVGKGGKMSTEAKKNLALLGGGTATGVLGKGEFDKYRLGRRVYEAQNQ